MDSEDVAEKRGGGVDWAARVCLRGRREDGETGVDGTNAARV